MSAVLGIALPEKWSTARLKHVTSLLNRGSAPTYVDQGPVRAISQAANQAAGLDWTRTRFHEFSGDPRKLKGFLRRDDVLINSTGTGTLGRVGYFTESPDELPCMADSHVTVVRGAPDELDSRYAYYWLGSRPFQEYVYTALIVGATNQIELNRDRLGDAPIPLPSLEEQRRIADFLDAETARIDLLSQRFSRLKELAVERARAVIDQSFSELPQNSMVPVSSVCRAIVDCVNKTAPTSEASTGFKMIRTSNIRDGRVDLTDCFTVERGVFVEWNRRGAPRVGDILLTREAPLGQVGMLLTDSPVFLGQRVMLYRADETEMRREVLLFNFLASHMGQQFRMLGAGSLHEHMRVGDGLKLRVHCPPRQMQDALVDRIEAGREQSVRLSQLADRQVALLAERRQSLISAAVTGQFDVSTASGRNVTE
ncbi:restriction endonuclease subunit S [Streptomyces sp. NPDC047097]|uniref:restriction endonuclease subunit S n=1 Tax=Streptomyces sp. NPDC047097 TaxID=3155260 RepID=UPI0033C4D07C